MTNAKRAGAMILCIGLVLVLAVSVVFIVHEADHDCSGEDCPICQAIAVNIRLLRLAGTAAFFWQPSFSCCPDRLPQTGRTGITVSAPERL
ncbi:MAG: hypothetical protein IKG23_03975 [Clostridia bacterium]|nr:hypothetical protein [Clostridia bacterium]